MNRLKQKYNEEIVPALKKELKVKSSFQVPRLRKIVINMGVSDPADPRARKQALENIKEQIALISGQHPQVTVAKKAISNFKLREGDPMGVMVTLRGERMWQFLDKLIAIVLPRVKDFRGVSRTAFDGHGNYSLGIEEQIIFPQIEYDKIERIRGLQVNLVTNSNDKDALRMLELLGMPFVKEK
ncbi:50S ribosomal protein L5 [bacterium]|nr:50S ribosomal protein L5 [bacterium]